MKRIEDDKALVNDYLTVLNGGGLRTFNGNAFSNAHQPPPTIMELMEQAEVRGGNNTNLMDMRLHEDLQREMDLRDNRALNL